MITIHLEKLMFKANHGLFYAEKIVGNEFEMNLSISFESEKIILDKIEDTINYVTVYEIVKKEMQQPRELLETFLTELAEILKTHFPQIKYLKMSIYKLAVPIIHFQGKTGVELTREWV